MGKQREIGGGRTRKEITLQSTLERPGQCQKERVSEGEVLTVTAEDTRIDLATGEKQGKKAINDTKQDAKAIKPEIQNRRTLENMRGW